jgi:hypothetical protein
MGVVSKGDGYFVSKRLGVPMFTNENVLTLILIRTSRNSPSRSSCAIGICTSRSPVKVIHIYEEKKLIGRHWLDWGYLLCSQQFLFHCIRTTHDNRHQSLLDFG